MKDPTPNPASAPLRPDPSEEETLDALVVLMRRALRAHKAPDALAGPSAEPWLTPADAAAYAAVSEDTLRMWIQTGQLPAGRVGKVIRIKRSDIDALFQSKQAKAPAAAELALPHAPAVADPTSDTTRAILSSLGDSKRRQGRSPQTNAGGAR